MSALFEYDRQRRSAALPPGELSAVIPHLAQESPARAAAPAADETVVDVRGVWKVFGPNADALCRGMPLPLEAELRGKGCTIGVNDVSFSVKRGEIFVLMGLSGSGKTTMLRCLTGLNAASVGRIVIGGTELTGASAAQLVALRRRKISMVFQNFALLPHLTALDNAAFPLKVQDVPKAERLAAAERALALVGLAEKGHRYPHELSGGQQQRVGIARSLVTDPEVWFLDEPFSALDPLIRREMQNEFLRLQSQLQKTIVFVTHDLDEAVRLGTTIAIMADGRLLQVGTPEDLVLRPASDYIRKFVAGVPKERVVTAGAIALPLDGSPLEDTPVDASAVLAAIAERVVLADRPVPVRSAAGTIVGQLTRAALMPWLL